MKERERMSHRRARINSDAVVPVPTAHSKWASPCVNLFDGNKPVTRPIPHREI